MANARIAELPRRGVVAVRGVDAEKFLNDLITSDMPAAGAAAYGGLLTPQGKILFDLIVLRDGDRFLFDLPKDLVADFVKRLGFYRLRAKVEIADISGAHKVVAAWGDPVAPALPGPVAADPRLAELGFRAIVPTSTEASAPGYLPASMGEYDVHRIRLGVPEGGIDFSFAEAFPHDADMDQLHGVDFTKGCYVGQEVVSRMQHRGTARRRVVIATGAGALPAAGTPVMAGEKALGVLGSSSGGEGLALVRLDRAKEAMDHGVAITANGTPLGLALPPWAKFAWPAAGTEDQP